MLYAYKQTNILDWLRLTKILDVYAGDDVGLL